MIPDSDSDSIILRWMHCHLPFAIYYHSTFDNLCHLLSDNDSDSDAISPSEELRWSPLQNNVWLLRWVTVYWVRSVSRQSQLSHGYAAGTFIINKFDSVLIHFVAGTHVILQNGASRVESSQVTRVSRVESVTGSVESSRVNQFNQWINLNLQSSINQVLYHHSSSTQPATPTWSIGKGTKMVLVVL